MAEDRVVTSRYNYTDACDKIRELTGKDTMYYSNQLEDGIQEVYEAGLAAGGGGTSNVDWWNSYLGYNESTGEYERTSFRYGFFGSGWNDTTFNPHVTICPTDARYMFQYTSVSYVNSSMVDLTKCSEIRNMFQNSDVVEVELDVTSPVSLDYTFNNCAKLKKVSLTIDAGNTFTANTFSMSSNIAELYLTGSLGKNGLNISNLTKITKDSIWSVLRVCNIPGSSITVTLPSTYGGTTDSTETLCTSGDLYDDFLAANQNGYTFTFA